MNSQLKENKLIDAWLCEKRTKTTRQTYLWRITKFLEYHNMTPEQLKKLESKEVRTLCLKFQNENLDMSANSRLATLTAVSSFMDHYDKTINWKRNTKVRPRPDFHSHAFSNGDLTKMFHTGDIRDKALISLASSLGWEIDGFLDLKKERVKELLDRAKDTNQEYIFFREIRQKTGVPRFGVINPLAQKWLREWFKFSESQPKQERKEIDRFSSKMKVSDVFDLTGNGIRYVLQTLAKKSGIKTVGKVRFHNIRKWVFGGLSRSGFNEFEMKYFVGKAIPMSDAVYLTTIEQSIIEKYPKAYTEYLNLEDTVSKEKMSEMEKELELATKTIEDQAKQMEWLSKQLEATNKLVNMVVEKVSKLKE